MTKVMGFLAKRFVKNMAKKGLAVCEDCGEEFEDGDEIHQCGFCNEIYCEDCWEDHNCLEDEYGDATAYCDDCRNDVDADNLKSCSECGENICDDCWNDHCKRHIEDKEEVFDYEEYVDKKVQEAI